MCIFSSRKAPASVSMSMRCNVNGALRETNLGALVNVKAMFMVLVLLDLLVSLFEFVPGPRTGGTTRTGTTGTTGRTRTTTVTRATPTRTRRGLTSSKRLMTIVTTTVTTTRKAAASNFMIHSVHGMGEGEEWLSFV